MHILIGGAFIMARQFLKAALGFACILQASSGLASADITKYVDVNGITTYTNYPQVNGIDGAQISMSDPAPDAAKKAISDVEIASVSNKPALENWTITHASARKVALDVETMRAARSTMLALDQSSHMSRRGEFIAYDQRNQGWFDFH
jgi:hypothetical protein